MNSSANAVGIERSSRPRANSRLRRATQLNAEPERAQSCPLLTRINPRTMSCRVKQSSIAARDGDFVQYVSYSPVVASVGQGDPPRTGTVCPNRARPVLTANSAVI